MRVESGGVPRLIVRRPRWDAPSRERGRIARVNARLFAPDARLPGDLVTLGAEEGDHAARVLRLRPGHAIRVFNGRGEEFDAVIEGVDRRRVHVRLIDARLAAPEAPVRVTYAPAALKGDKMDAVVRDAVMMGVAAIQPIVTARSEVTCAALERGHRRERWERVAVASAKQCGRAVVPAVLAACTFDALTTADMRPGLAHERFMFVEPGAVDDATPLGELEGERPLEATVIVGPEGGWTPEEIARGRTASQLVTLRAPTLRADAMPTVALAGLFARWGIL